MLGNEGAPVHLLDIASVSSVLPSWPPLPSFLPLFLTNLPDSTRGVGWLGSQGYGSESAHSVYQPFSTSTELLGLEAFQEAQEWDAVPLLVLGSRL